MFRKSFQKGFLTVLYAGGANPLKIWDRMVVNGHIKRVTDEDVRTLVIEMRGTNVATCYIYSPINPKDVLGIALPFLILDDRNMRRRFRVSNFQTTTKVRPFGTTMPIGLNPGWNQIQFNLADFTKRAYGSCYVETQRIQIHANCRIRRIYFCDQLYPDDKLPNEYKLFYPCVEEKKKPKAETKTEERAEVPPPSEAGDEVEQEEMERPEGEEFLGMENPVDFGVPVYAAEEEEGDANSVAVGTYEGDPALDEAESKDAEGGQDDQEAADEPPPPPAPAEEAATAEETQNEEAD